jgi:hypothetical protein
VGRKEGANELRRSEAAHGEVGYGDEG